MPNTFRLPSSQAEKNTLRATEPCRSTTGEETSVPSASNFQSRVPSPSNAITTALSVVRFSPLSTMSTPPSSSVTAGLLRTTVRPVVLDQVAHTSPFPS